MRIISYNLFSISLFLWTAFSMKEQLISVYVYALGLVTLTGFILVIVLMTKKDMKERILNGMILAAVLINVGMSINCRCQEADQTFYEALNNSYFVDLIMMLLVFFIVYMVIRFLPVYRLHIVNYGVMLAILIVIFGARLTGTKSYGAYITFFGLNIVGLALMGFPFVAAHAMSSRENKYLGKKVTNMSWNLASFLLYTLVIYLGCALCNEFGLLLIIGLTSTVLFFIRCKDIKSSLFYTFICAGGALFAATHIGHIENRVQIWLDPVSAFHNDALKEKADSVLYLFRHIDSMGFWGKGIGNLSKAYYPTLDSDHVLILLMNDYSILLAAGVILISILYVRWMLDIPEGLKTYDRYLNLASAMIVSFILLLNISSVLGSFITAGMGFPFISDGSVMNMMFMSLAAIHCGLLGRKEKVNASTT